MSSARGLTTTSYAILGLLAIQPWSTYELAQQMDRSLGRMWPRAQSKIYEEPKKLVAHALRDYRQRPTRPGQLVARAWRRAGPRVRAAAQNLRCRKRHQWHRRGD